ncbi:MAG: hypothetical protein ACUVUA_17450, partial [Chloroflexus sp.]
AAACGGFPTVIVPWMYDTASMPEQFARRGDAASALVEFVSKNIYQRLSYSTDRLQDRDKHTASA